MARPDVLVTADWAENNLDAPNTVFVEVDEDTSAYDTGHIPGAIKLLPPYIIESTRSLKTEILNEKNLSLDLLEALIALSISATTNPAAQLAMEKLVDLKGCEVHMSHIPTPGDEAGLRRLGVNLTSDPNFSTKDLFIT